MPVILVIEDNIRISQLYEVNLTARGYTVITYKTSDEGLAGLRTQTVGLLLLNMLIPGEVTGWGILEEMTADETLSHIPIIIVTGAIEEYKRSYGDYEQVKHVMLKPADISQLLGYVRDLVPPPG